MIFFKRRAETQEIEETQSAEDDILQAFCGEDHMTFDLAMKIPAFSSCINLIANTISMIPIRLYQRKEDAVEEIKDDARVYLLNYDPKDTLSATQLKKALVREYFNKGGYIFINRNGLKVESLHFVESKEISFRYSTDPIFKDYKITVRGTEYEPYQFLKILRSTKNGYEGQNFIEENKEILGVAYAYLQYERILVKTGGNKKGFIKTAHKLTEAAKKALKEGWRKLYQNNTENVVILQDGMDFKESSNTSVEMQINENKKTNSDEICKIFDIQPEMIKGNAKESDKIKFIQYCINPILTEIECALNRDLLLETEKESCFFAADTSDLTKGDIKTRYEAYAIACKNGFLQLDEVRAKENLPELGLDFIKFGLQDVMYNTKTGEFYIPNMNGSGRFGKEGKTSED